MPKTFSYEQLEHKLLRLEKRYSKLRENFRDIEDMFNFSIDMLCIWGSDLYYKRVNPAFEKTLGYSRRELMAAIFTEFIHPEDRERTKVKAQEFFTTGVPVYSFENRMICKDGSYKWIAWAAHPTVNKRLAYSVGRDVTAIKRDREELQKTRDELEKMVAERTAELVRTNEALTEEMEERKKMVTVLRKNQKELRSKTSNLEELNAALRVLLKQRDSDKIEFEENVLFNINKQVLTYLERLQESVLNDRQGAYVDLVKKGLDEIVSSFPRRLASSHLSLTPAELQVADLITHGKTTKEIAELLTLSPRTIESHRKHIRRKLSIKNARINLRTHLISLQ